jgi:myo-inositol 2-dehydrogenase/D-chiro-inositol 1-dehydrogenase
LQSFVAAIREKRPTAVSGEDGRISIVMVLAARKSFDERRPVRLDEIEHEARAI